MAFFDYTHVSILIKLCTFLVPLTGESIPIRLFLGAYELGTTMKDVCRKFSVRFFLNLVLVDEEDRRYFKQQEIILWRKADLKASRKAKKVQA